MTNPNLLTCDGCGQPADSAHLSRRLDRLASSTRFRPLHIQTLLLAAIPPANEPDFLYSPNEQFHGEAAALLNAVQLSTQGKLPETVLAEFQKLGLFLAHVIECPVNEHVSEIGKHALIEKQLPAAIARIRRSLKPKRILLLSADLQPHADKLRSANFNYPVLPPARGTFLPAYPPTDVDLQAFRFALAISNAHAV